MIFGGFLVLVLVSVTVVGSMGGWYYILFYKGVGCLWRWCGGYFDFGFFAFVGVG